MSFRWTSSNDMANTIRNNYCEKEDLRYEVLTGVNMHDKIECEDKEASVKEMLKMQK